MLLKFTQNYVPFTLSVATALIAISCDRKESAPANSTPLAKETAAVPAKEPLSKKLGDLAVSQEEISRDLGTVTDAKSCAAANDRLAVSMDQWLKLVPALESENDVDGTLMAAANKVGKAMGANHRTALRVSEPYKDDAQVSAKLGKLRSLEEKLMK